MICSCSSLSGEKGLPNVSMSSDRPGRPGSGRAAARVMATGTSCRSSRAASGGAIGCGHLHLHQLFGFGKGCRRNLRTHGRRCAKGRRRSRCPGLSIGELAIRNLTCGRLCMQRRSQHSESASYQKFPSRMGFLRQAIPSLGVRFVCLILLAEATFSANKSRHVRRLCG